MAVSQETMDLLRGVSSDRISVLVVGDQNVGKTALVRKPDHTYSSVLLLTAGPR